MHFMFMQYYICVLLLAAHRNGSICGIQWFENIPKPYLNPQPIHFHPPTMDTLTDTLINAPQLDT